MFAVLYINVRICKYSYCSSFTCNKAHVPYQKPMRSMHHQHKYEQCFYLMLSLHEFHEDFMKKHRDCDT